MDVSVRLAEGCNDLISDGIRTPQISRNGQKYDNTPALIILSLAATFIQADLWLQSLCIKSETGVRSLVPYLLANSTKDASGNSHVFLDYIQRMFQLIYTQRQTEYWHQRT